MVPGVAAATRPQAGVCEPARAIRPQGHTQRAPRNNCPEISAGRNYPLTADIVAHRKSSRREHTRVPEPAAVGDCVDRRQRVGLGRVSRDRRVSVESQSRASTDGAGLRSGVPRLLGADAAQPPQSPGPPGSGPAIARSPNAAAAIETAWIARAQQRPTDLCPQRSSWANTFTTATITTTARWKAPPAPARRAVVVKKWPNSRWPPALPNRPR